jgi:hypothetical protein
MVNLASLSALIRTLRHTTGVEGAAAPIVRVGSVAPVARDDTGAMLSTALRNPQQARTAIPDALLDRAVRGPVAQRPQDDATDVAAQRASPALANEESTALVLTHAARVVQSALRTSGARNAAPPTIASPAPLAGHAEAASAQVARALAGAIVESGLFYESHLARALQRDYPLGALAREPQAGFPLAAAESMPDGSTAAVLSEPASAMLARQLDALETRTIVWSGEVWPGRAATIEIGEDEAASRDPDGDRERDTVSSPSWLTRITIDLPSLGPVAARLELRGDTLSLAIVARSTEARGRIAAARDRLADSLAADRIALRAFDVVAEPEPR